MTSYRKLDPPSNQSFGEFVSRSCNFKITMHLLVVSSLRNIIADCFIIRHSVLHSVLWFEPVSGDPITSVDGTSLRDPRRFAAV